MTKTKSIKLYCNPVAVFLLIYLIIRKNQIDKILIPKLK